jgi:hypothetical protein
MFDGSESVCQPDTLVHLVQPASERGERCRRSCESLAHILAQVAEVVPQDAEVGAHPADVALGRHFGAHLPQEPQDQVVGLVAHAFEATTPIPRRGDALTAPASESLFARALRLKPELFGAADRAPEGEPRAGP